MLGDVEQADRADCGRVQCDPAARRYGLVLDASIETRGRRRDQPRSSGAPAGSDILVNNDGIPAARRGRASRVEETRAVAILSRRLAVNLVPVSWSAASRSRCCGRRPIGPRSSTSRCARRRMSTSGNQPLLRLEGRHCRFSRCSPKELRPEKDHGQLHRGLGRLRMRDASGPRSPASAHIERPDAGHAAAPASATGEDRANGVAWPRIRRASSPARLTRRERRQLHGVDRLAAPARAGVQSANRWVPSATRPKAMSKRAVSAEHEREADRPRRHSPAAISSVAPWRRLGDEPDRSVPRNLRDPQAVPAGHRDAGDAGDDDQCPERPVRRRDHEARARSAPRRWCWRAAP